VYVGIRFEGLGHAQLHPTDGMVDWVPKPKVERPTLAKRVVVNYQRLKGPHVKPSEIRSQAKQGPTPGNPKFVTKWTLEIGRQ
jgi:hypothetical protein